MHSSKKLEDACEGRIDFTKTNASKIDSDDEYTQTSNDNEKWEYISHSDAKKICDQIADQFVQPTKQREEKRLRSQIIMEIKRKYTIQFREAMKFIIELIILQLTLFSCAQKANIFGLLYLGLLIMYLVI